jgi:hypothetical protein
MTKNWIELTKKIRNNSIPDGNKKFIGEGNGKS